MGYNMSMETKKPRKRNYNEFSYVVESKESGKPVARVCSVCNHYMDLKRIVCSKCGQKLTGPAKLGDHRLAWWEK